MDTLSKAGKILFLCITICLTSLSERAGAQNCTGGTPFFTVNLTGSPNGTWISPLSGRGGTCCVTETNCIEFEVTLDPAATAINFGVHSGAVPPGALYYQVNCGPLTTVGTPICLTGAGPHTITFCKPGGNFNEFVITSITDPTVSNDLVINDGCTGVLSVTGLNPATITWTSVAPGVNGAYNNYLDCTTGCSTVNVTGQAAAPPFVDYMVCGTANGVCAGLSYCDTIRVTFFPTLNVAIQPANPVICYGMTGITLTATGTGGLPPYTFSWSNGTVTTSNSTSQIFAGPGIQTVVMQDNSDCPPVTAQVNVLSFPQEVTANAGSDIILCRANPTATLSGAVTGTTSVLWLGGSGTFTPSNTVLNPSYTPSANELSAGFVTLYLKADNGACLPDFDTLTISFKSFNGAPLLGKTDISCNGAQDGILTPSVSGTANPYLFSLNGNAITPPVQNLSAGNYTILFEDAVGCDTSLSATISEPPALNLGVNINSHVTCNGAGNGNATINVSGGTPPYQMTLNGSPITSTFLSQLTAGTHVVNVTDSKGCLATQSILINEPAVLTISLAGVTHATCLGSPNGQATVGATGGTAPYQFSWNTIPAQSGPTASALSAGIYTVTVTDANLCQETIQVEITQPSALNLTVQTQDVDCSGNQTGFATATVSGGSGNYTYLWSTGSTNPGSLGGLPLGSYSLQVTDGNGCTISSPFIINEPSALSTVITSVSHVTCNGLQNGSIQSVSNGGTPPYSYSWNTIPQQAAANAFGLAAGSYQLIVTDDNGCVTSATATINQPTPLSVSLQGTDPKCFQSSDGSISATPAGGTAPYSYSWSTSSVNQNINGLPAGIYTLTLLDANNCTTTASHTLLEPDALQLDVSSPQHICPGTSSQISAIAIGGNGSYQYSWSHNLPGISVHTVAPSQTSAYVVTVVDAKGCIAGPDTAWVNLQILNAGWINATIDANICEGEEATLAGTLTPPNWPYQLSWSHGLGSNPGVFTVNPGGDTVYTFTLTDYCNNSISDTALVRVHPYPELSMPALLAEGCPPLSIQIPEQNGFPAGTEVIWNFGDGNSSTLQLPGYTYNETGNFHITVEATTPFGCSRTFDNSSLVRVLPKPKAYFEPEHNKISLLNPSVRFFNHTIGAVIYHWDFGDQKTSSRVEPLHYYEDAGTYVVKLLATNTLGCTDTFQDQVIVEGEFALYIPNAISPNGDGMNDYFQPIGEGFMPSSFSMQIYDRWGELVFKTESYDNFWDGNLESNQTAMQDTYVYIIRVTDLYQKNHEYTGHVTVVR